MIIKAHKKKCDQCGKKSEWIEHKENNPIVPIETKGWLSVSLSRPQDSPEYKDYCCKDCVKKAIDTL